MKRRTMLTAGAALAAGATRARAAEAPIRIGVALSQSGDLADSAGHYFDGLKLWRDRARRRMRPPP